MKNASRVLIGAQLLLALIYTLPLFSPALIKNSDFISFYTGWTIVRNGHGPDIYDFDVQANYQVHVAGPEGLPFSYRVLPFINPPHAAILFSPLAYLSLNSAAYVFLALNCLIAAWIMRRLWEFAADWSSTARILLLTTAVGSEVFWYGLATRTMTLIMFAALLEYFLALRNKQDSRAGVWLFVATLKPQLVFLPALIPLALRRWRLLTIVIGASIVTAIVISLIFGFHIWSDYLRALREVSAHGAQYGASVAAMNNLRMLLDRILPSSLVLPVVYLALLCGIVSTFLLWRSARDFDLRFAITVLLGLLLAPHLNYQDTFLALLPAAIGYEHLRHKNTGLINVLIVCILIATFAPPLLIFSGNQTLRWIWPMPIMLTLIVMLITVLNRSGDDQYEERHAPA